MLPIALLERRKADSAIVDQNSVIAKTLKKEPVAVAQAYGGIIEELPSWSDSGAKSTTVARPPGVHRKIVMQSVKTTTWNDICSRWNHQGKTTTHS